MFGDQDPKTLVCIHNVSGFLLSWGKLDEAEKLAREAARSRPDDVTLQTLLRTLLKDIAEARKKRAEAKKKDSEDEQ
jgi:predicted Zn-dependent protease